MKKVSININGDLPDRELIKRARIAEEAGIERVWIGELELFRDPAEVAKTIASETSLDVCILLSPFRRGCDEIVKIAEEYIVGIIPGRSRDLSHLISCLERVKEVAEEVYVGCSGPKLAEIASRLADGLLLNYIHPEYVHWLTGFADRSIHTAAFGPSLVLPSEFYEDLLIAAAIVMGSNETFLREFRLLDVWEDISRTDFEALIRARQEGKSVYGLEDFETIRKHEQLLIERFTLSGSPEEVAEKTRKLLKVCDQVVLGDPFFRDLESMGYLAGLLAQL